MADQPKHVTYADAGVDVDEGARAVDCIKDAVKATNRPEVIGGLGGFGSCFSMKGFKDMEDPVLVSGTDGVGTKLAIAQLLDRHDTVGEDLVAMCVDDVVPIGAEPLFFLDYVAIGKLRAEHVAEIVKGIAEGCKKSGCLNPFCFHIRTFPKNPEYFVYQYRSSIAVIFYNVNIFM